MMNRATMRAALKASSRAVVRPKLSPHAAIVDQRYRMQVRQVEEMLGMHTPKKEGAVSQVCGAVGSLLGWGFGLIALFHVLSRI